MYGVIRGAGEYCASRPPSSGPLAAPTPMPAAATKAARFRSSRGSVSTSAAAAVPCTAPRAKPCTALPANSQPTPVAVANTAAPPPAGHMAG